MSKQRKRHTPEQIVKKLRDAEAMLNAGKDLSAVIQSLEVSEATFHRWRAQYGGMKSEEARRLKQLEEENKRLKEIVAEQQLDIRMLKHLTEKNWPVFSTLAPLAGLPGSGPASKSCRRPLTFPSEEHARSWTSPAARSVINRSLVTMSRSC